MTDSPVSPSGSHSDSPSDSADIRRCVVVGVTSGQPDAVVRTAVGLAAALGVDLVCAHVDRGAYVVAEHPDGSVEARPIDPDASDWTGNRFDPTLAHRIGRLAEAAQVRIQVRELAGGIAQALGRLAGVLDAQLIVVGSRGGPGFSMHEHIGRSVAGQLAHRQPRPVVIVPWPHHAGGSSSRGPAA